MVDWSKLQIKEHSEWKTFEQLCYCVATNQFSDFGSFVSVDDRGGGDGVEFYQRRGNGDEWGWQAKSYFHDGLSKSGRKKTIIESLEKALKVHPHLRKWFLCTPIDFTGNDQKWFDDTLKEALKKRLRGKQYATAIKDLELVHWGDREFSNFIKTQDNVGVRSFFFGELELDPKWFERQYKNQTASFVSRYPADLHINTDTDDIINAFLANEDCAHHIELMTKNLRKNYLPNCARSLKTLFKQSRPKGISKKDWTELITTFDVFRMVLLDALDDLEDLRKEISEGNRPSILWECIYSSVMVMYDASEDIANQIFDDLTEDVSGSDEAPPSDRGADKIFGIISETLESVEDIEEVFEFFMNPFLTNLSMKDLHLHGRAGVGKTDTLLNCACRLLKERRPVIYLPGRCFYKQDTLRNQILNQLNVPSTYGWDSFLAALKTAALVYKRDVLIIIDGLDEATRNGSSLSAALRLDIHGLVNELVSTDHIILLTSWRDEYTDFLWEDKKPANMAFVYPPRLSSPDTIRKFLDYYQIEVDDPVFLAYHFKEPVFLKMWCETLNPDRTKKTVVNLQQFSIVNAIDEYIDCCERFRTRKSSTLHNRGEIRGALNKITRYLWERNLRNLSLEETFKIIDEKPEVEWEKSLTNLLLDEGLFICKNLNEGTEEVEFKYNFMTGYFYADYILGGAKTREDVKRILHSKGVKNKLLGTEKQKHPLNGRILETLGIVLPLRGFGYIHDYYPEMQIQKISAEAIFHLPPQLIDRSCVMLVKKFIVNSGRSTNIMGLLWDFSSYPSHPMNFKFTSKVLSEFDDARLDRVWGDLLDHYEDTIIISIIEYKQSLGKHSESKLDKDILFLNGLKALWAIHSKRVRIRKEAIDAMLLTREKNKQVFEKLMAIGTHTNSKRMTSYVTKLQK